MPDYQYYQEVFCGYRISQEKFRNRIARAKEWLEGLERRYTVISYGPDSRKLALCAIAEVLDNWEKTGNYAAVTMGGVSVHYEKRQTPLRQQVLQSITGYLEIYRGVG